MRLKSGFFLLLFMVALTSAGNSIPDFKLKDLNNKWQKFENVSGEQLTVIDFWATWCGPCARALPKLNMLYNLYREKGVAFIGLNVDSPRNTAKVKPFARSKKIAYPVLLDPNSELSARLNVASIPTLLIVNSEKEIVYRHTGYRPGDEKIIEAEIKKLLSAGDQ